jgi:hypothetical protein
VASRPGREVERLQAELDAAVEAAVPAHVEVDPAFADLNSLVNALASSDDEEGEEEQRLEKAAVAELREAIRAAAKQLEQPEVCRGACHYWHVTIGMSLLTACVTIYWPRVLLIWTVSLWADV